MKETEHTERILSLLPPKLRQELEKQNLNEIDEIRLRIGQPPAIVRSLTERPLTDAEVCRQDLDSIVMAASGCSVYSVQNQLSSGYLILPGGHRLGICGTIVQERGRIYTIRDFSSLSIRFARWVDADISALQPFLEDDLLVIGPPGSGKTTLLRSLIRAVSESGSRVGVADERGEIAAVYEGKPQFPLGPCTDVMSGGKKSESMLLLLRAMTPAWLAIDEITAPEDVQAVRQVSYCGARLFATAHAQNVGELAARPLYRELIELGVFKRAVVLNEERSFTVEEVAKC